MRAVEIRLHVGGGGRGGAGASDLRNKTQKKAVEETLLCTISAFNLRAGSLPLLPWHALMSVAFLSGGSESPVKARRA